MSVTIKEIARAAGVSRGTVDRVLHNRSGVNQDVAERIRRMAEEMGFTPNRAGKILAARKQPMSIGCLLPDEGNPFFSDVIAGFQRAQNELADFGVTVHVEHIKGFDPATHINAVNRLAAEGYSGLCLTTMDIPEVQLAVHTVIGKGIPVVSVNTDIPDTGRICYVGPDYFNDGQTAAGLLARMTDVVLHVLIVTGSYYIRGHKERINGFISGMKHHKVSFMIADTIESQDDDEYAYVRTVRSLSQHPDINCVFIGAGGVTGVCTAVKHLQRTAVHILSFDAVPSTVGYVKDGTIDFTICQEPERQGYMAIKKLFDYLISDDGRDPEDFITDTIIKIAENIP
jgi:LacI family transcriptional regulator